MTRRDFLSAAAASSLVTASFADSALSPTAGRRMRIALTPGSIGVAARSQAEVNLLAQRHGFEAVEPMAAELAAMPAETLAATLDDLKAKGLTWAAAGLPVDFRGDESVFRQGLARLGPLATGLRRAGVSRVGTWLLPSHPTLTYQANFRRHTERLREVASVLGEHGLRLGLEYVGTRLLLTANKYPFVHTLAEARELIAAIATGNVGVVLDTWHWWQAGDTVEEIASLRPEEVVSVDLNDAPQGREKALQRDNERELPLATGVIDAAAFLNALQRIGYDGPVRPEPFNRTLNEMDDEAACRAAAAALHRAMTLIRPA